MDTQKIMNNTCRVVFLLWILPAISISVINCTPPIIHDANTTLQTILDLIGACKKGAYMPLHKDLLEKALGKNPHKTELQQACALNAPTILKALPLEFFNWSTHFIAKCLRHYSIPLGAVYSNIAFEFTAANNPDLCINTLKLLKKECYLFVGYESISPKIRNLVCNAQCTFIPLPHHITPSALDSLEKKCKEVAQKDSFYKVIITAAGSTGTILQKRLWNALDNVFLLDLDNFITMLDNQETTGWATLAHFDTQRFIQMLTGDIKIVCTSALLNRTDSDNKKRKQEYSISIKALAQYGYPKPYIVESVTPKGPTFFEDYTPYVCYSNVNNAGLKNKGVNEARSILAAFQDFKFNDNDIIVKLTGRYLLTSDKFLRYIESHPTVDAFVHINDDKSVCTGCFALRYKYFKNMLETIDYDALEKQMKPIEWEVFDYLKQLGSQNKITIACLDTLNLSASINYPPPGYTLMQF